MTSEICGGQLVKFIISGLTAKVCETMFVLTYIGQESKDASKYSSLIGAFIASYVQGSFYWCAVQLNILMVILVGGVYSM